MRVGQDLHSLIISDHFFSRCISGKAKEVEAQTFLIDDILLKDAEDKSSIDRELMIERNRHLCCIDTQKF